MLFNKLNIVTKTVSCNFIPDDEIWVSKSVYDSITEKIDEEGNL